MRENLLAGAEAYLCLAYSDAVNAGSLVEFQITQVQPLTANLGNATEIPIELVSTEGSSQSHPIGDRASFSCVIVFATMERFYQPHDPEGVPCRAISIIGNEGLA